LSSSKVGFRGVEGAEDSEEDDWLEGDGLLEGTVFKQLIDTIGRLDFFSEAWVRVGIEIGTGVTEAVEIVGFGCEEGFEIGTTLKGLSDMTGRTEGFFSKAGAGVGTGTETGAFGTVEIAGVLEIVEPIAGAVEIGAATDEVSSCARHSKRVSWSKWSKCSTKLLKGRTTNRITKKNNKRSSAIASLARS
jgi:hypothetical protein